VVAANKTTTDADKNGFDSSEGDANPFPSASVVVSAGMTTPNPVDPHGLWLQTTEAVALPVAGTAHLSTTLALCAGWNLIGYPLTTPQLVGAALASIAGKYSRVVAYDAFDIGGPLPDPWEVHNTAAPAWANDLAVMHPGRGYWLYATEDMTLTLWSRPATTSSRPPWRSRPRPARSPWASRCC
jgi:hypothetical protein